MLLLVARLSLKGKVHLKKKVEWLREPLRLIRLMLMHIYMLQCRLLKLVSSVNVKDAVSYCRFSL